MLPNFIGIGAQRAGTTWLHRCLSEHPQVFVPQPKEVHFFNRQFERGQAWYEERFAGAEGRIAVGEITPNYLNSPAAIPRMASVIPDARLLVVLREPVARAYSAYCLYHKQYNGLSFRQACESGRSLVELGLYAEQLQRVFNHYRREQVKVLLYEDIQVRPAQALAVRTARGHARERREQSEVDVHRLERFRSGVDRLDVPARDVSQQRAVRGCRRRRRERQGEFLGGRETPGEQTDGGGFHIAFAAGDLSGEAQPRHGAQPQRSVQARGQPVRATTPDLCQRKRIVGQRHASRIECDQRHIGT